MSWIMASPTNRWSQRLSIKNYKDFQKDSTQKSSTRTSVNWSKPCNETFNDELALTETSKWFLCKQRIARKNRLTKKISIKCLID